MADAGIEWVGEDKLKLKLTQKLFAEPTRRFLRKGVGFGKQRVRTRSPKDTFRLGGSFEDKVDGSSFPMWGSVSSNAPSARPMEWGTGLLSEASDSKHQRHFPPGPALDGWAQRHGFENGWAVARAIAKRGGLRPRRMLRDAWEDLRGRLPGFVKQMAQDVERMWAR